ncbi:MAG: ROK family transcriptional regulator [Spirochaetaceae bacterium]|nr:ROK family transcriptional regulator [Spirochaetaceae bacterium]
MATQSKLNRINVSQVLRSIWLNKGISRIRIAEMLHMDKSTVTKIVSSLLELGIVQTMEEGSASPRGGRKPVPLSINISYGCILGIEIQTDIFNVVIINLQGEIISRYRDKIDFGEKELIDVFSEILTNIMPHTENLGLLGIVVGLCGIVNSEEGIIQKSNPLNIVDAYPFCHMAEERFSLPVFIENDANCCCWGELTSQKTQRPENMLYMLGQFREVETHHAYYSGIGIGFGIVINGKVYSGLEHSAGEFKSIFSKAPSISQFSLPDDQIENIQNKPEEFAALLRELTRNISLVINFFNLNHIVIGGEIECYKDMIEKMLTHEIQQNWSYPEQMTFSISSSNQGNQAVAYGAACMFLENLFSIPEMNNRPEKGIKRGIELLETIKEVQPAENEDSKFTFNPI